MDTTEHFIPSIVLEPDEIKLPSGSAFAEICALKSRDLIAHVGGQLNESVLTFSKSAGLIWRGDFTTLLNASSGINRVICGQRPTDACIQIAVASAHSIPPLSDYLQAQPDRTNPVGDS